MTQTKNFAAEVLKSFPTPKQIMTDKNYKATKVMQPIYIVGWRNAPNAWEAIAMTVNDMMNNLQGKPFSAWVNPQHKKGFAVCYDFHGREHKVSFEEFQALNLIMYCSWMNIPFTEEMYKAYFEFKVSQLKFCNILD